MFGLKAQSNFQLFQSYYVKGCLHKHNNSRDPKQREAGEGKPALSCLLPACAWEQIYSHTESSVRGYDGKKESELSEKSRCVHALLYPEPISVSMLASGDCVQA